ncbi:methyl-accepting chemotaxis protein [Paraburkholderia caballeronis]|uniref:Methyl-accepting chemotaxis sensory transducer with TarH sensor n=1 Tax=Paraburkholderia caballeronis TaxID=416943 RepID=A0A1H7TV08_9BURK|nr:methyl-accepting chemotaxis protein [Paraburkholderia caballeronis]PXW17663.1 methyl-accepting chemotaxis sensory transducer with TarH sensor [Paraburkholderia caballeronis]PXW95408.1 methyl-accepting chemotaxis sensory transducer with TarH sensor [Paraburkholderia caballeronis]RAJ91222.1 methyl-accepting chemotaxis sensory transducer with TarH sensor [Paraburkholderia caballeronis]SEE12164.1 methyl-accepting chemotaxis sensory transducer with TarH sensor [Paraburkholderia caballeronis]SEL8
MNRILARVSISARLWATVAALGALLVVTGWLGLFGMQRSNDALGYAYSNQLASSIALGKTTLNLTIVRTTLDRVVLHPDSPRASALTDRALDYLAISQRAWDDYAALPHAPAEQKLADAVAAARAALLQQGLTPLVDALRHGDRQTADDLVMERMLPLSVALTKQSDALDGWLATHGRQAYDEAGRRFQMLRVAAVALIVFGLAVCGFCAVGLRRSIALPLTEAGDAMQRIAAGDLTVPLAVRSSDEVGRVVEGLRTMQHGLAGTVRKVAHSAESIATATREIAAGNRDLSQRTEEQAASLEEGAASMAQLSATVRQNAEHALAARALADRAHGVARRGAQVAGDAVRTMGDIDASSRQIADITGVIEGIAFQTSILALNAAVEAARAGEQGRGFAVVASEVRSLAQRSATAAREIKTLIDASVERVGAGARLVGDAGATMEETRESIARVTALMEEIAHASDEQRQGIEQMSRAISQMDQVSQQNAALVEQAAAAATALDDQAGVLREAVAVFRV